MATSTIVVRSPIEERLAAYGLHRCAHCRRILLQARLRSVAADDWQCRDGDDCHQASRARPRRVPVDLIALEVGEEPAPGPEPTRTSDAPDPEINAWPLRCVRCGQRLPQAEGVMVQEEIGRACCCHSCARQLPPTASTAGALPHVGIATHPNLHW